MLKNGLIDGIIPEPLGGAHVDVEETIRIVKNTIKKELKELNKLSPQERINNRIEKFASMGVFNENAK